ncbi:hypothetical protein A4V12_09830 [Streptomyces noursei]|nr:hypothetical protein A4V12_09830 [Streptomyces noursei]
MPVGQAVGEAGQPADGGLGRVGVRRAGAGRRREDGYDVGGAGEAADEGGAADDGAALAQAFQFPAELGWQAVRVGGVGGGEQ